MINNFLFAVLSEGTAYVEIIDEEVPAVAAPHCTIHWAVLGVIGIYAIFAMIRAISNSRSANSGEEG